MAYGYVRWSIREIRVPIRISLAAAGFTCYRGNPAAWFWRAASGQDTGIVQKSVRLLDHYIPIATSNPAPSSTGADTVLNLPASRFFRPFDIKLDGYGGQQLKVRRILSEMTEAARTGNTYHLWWHPHNLATHPGKNMAALDQILRHYPAIAQKVRNGKREYGRDGMPMRETSVPHDRLLLRITTVPISLRLLITGQPRYMKEHGMRCRAVQCRWSGTGYGDGARGLSTRHRTLYPSHYTHPGS